jgi:hypothetical protein
METDCFASSRVRGCRALKTGAVCGPDCPFRKTKAAYELSRQKADRRLASLPMERQQDIARAYHEGALMWLRRLQEAAGE